MKLFNYGECKCCKKMQNNNNVELSKLLPSNICDKITDHNIYCVKCCNVFEREQRLLRVKDIHDYDKFYLQLKVFVEHNKKPHPFSWQCSKTHYNKNMDEFFEDEDLIERFGGGVKNVKKYRAFAKKNRELFIWIDHNIYRIETIQEILKQWNVRKDAYFKYYGKKYSVVLLINLIVWEMVYYKIGKENIKYIDVDDIGKYADNIMNEYLPEN